MGCSRANCPAIVRRSSLACASVTPGCSRATTSKYWTSRFAIGSPSLATGDVGTSEGANTQRSGFGGCLNICGMTPTTVVGIPLRRIVRPTTPGSPPRCCVHRPSETTAMRGPRGESSCWSYTRPCNAGTPNTSKNAAVVSNAVSRTGSALPVRSVTSWRKPATAAKLRL